MKLSETNYKHFLMFVDNDNTLVHTVLFKDYPNIITMRTIFDELVTDLGLDCESVDELRIAILPINEYIEEYGDMDLWLPCTKSLYTPKKEE